MTLSKELREQGRRSLNPERIPLESSDLIRQRKRIPKESARTGRFQASKPRSEVIM